jgi:hypothetical protein
MSLDATTRWLRPRLAEAPPELADDVLRLVASTPGLDLEDPISALIGAALAGLEQVADGTGERSEALRLLAADAALTYAFEAAAQSGRTAEVADRVGLAGALGDRLVAKARLRGPPGVAEES